MTKRFCDRCGICADDTKILISWGAMLDPPGRMRRFDLCRKCNAELMKKFLKKGLLFQGDDADSGDEDDERWKGWTE